MLSTKSRRDLSDGVAEHLAKCLAAVDPAENVLYALLGDQLYEYQLPELEDISELGRELVTHFQDEMPFCGIAWLGVMVEKDLITDQNVLEEAHRVLAEVIGVLPPSPILHVVEISMADFIRLVEEEGAKQAEKILELPPGAIELLLKELELDV